MANGPIITNKMRADRFDAALEHHATHGGRCPEGLKDDPADILMDLLSNVRHWCDRVGIDFATLDRRADVLYREERADEPTPKRRKGARHG